MSATLLKRSLELVESDTKIKDKKINKRNQGIFDFIPVTHRSVKVVEKSGKIENKSVFNIADSSSRKSKKNKKKTDIIKSNLKKLEHLHNQSLAAEISKKIIKRARYNKPAIEIEEEKPDEKTAFTEEDFKKFEQEYFCSS